MENDNHIQHLIVNIIVAVALASTFIGIFFFTYAKGIERQIVVQNVNYTVDDLIGTVLTIAPTKIKTTMSEQLDQVKLGDMSSADAIVESNNKALLIKASKVLGTLLAVGLITAYLICKKYDLDFIEVITQNLILLCGIAIIEFIFLKYVVANFISANPNIIKKKLIEIIKE